MKSKKVIIISIVFFVLVNTAYFIEKLPALWDLLTALIITLGYFVLAAILIVQLYKLYKEKLSDKLRITSTVILLVTIILTSAFPRGIINYENLEGEDLLIANIEGAANCQTIIKMKKNNKFIQTSLCFGVDKWRGTYKIIADTIKFQYNDTTDLGKKFAYGIIKLTTGKSYIKIGEIFLFENYKDTIGLPMMITLYNKK